MKPCTACRRKSPTPPLLHPRALWRTEDSHSLCKKGKRFSEDPWAPPWRAPMNWAQLCLQEVKKIKIKNAESTKHWQFRSQFIVQNIYIYTAAPDVHVAFLKKWWGKTQFPVFVPSVLMQHVKQTEFMHDSHANAASWYTPVQPLNPNGTPCRGVHRESVNWYRSVSAEPHLCPCLLKTLLFIRFHRSHPKEESQLRNRWETDIDHSFPSQPLPNYLSELVPLTCELILIVLSLALSYIFSFFLCCTCCQVSAFVLPFNCNLFTFLNLRP